LANKTLSISPASSIDEKKMYAIIRKEFSANSKGKTASIKKNYGTEVNHKPGSVLLRRAYPTKKR